MEYKQKRYVPLDSMGESLDAAAPSESPWLDADFTAGFKVFNPVTSTIETYDSNNNLLSSRSVRVHELYLNLITHRAYIWDGDQMVEADLSVELLMPEAQPTQGDTDFSQDNRVYHITEHITISGTSNLIVGDNITMVFHEGGCITGGTLEGRYSSISDPSDPDYGKLCSVKVVPSGEQKIFDGCSITGCRLVDSELFATNFGASSGMSSVIVESAPQGVTGLTLPFNLRQGVGTDNADSFDLIGEFLSGSENVKLKFNGFFYTSDSHVLEVSNARYLELFGDAADGTTHPECKLIHGIKLVDCYMVHIHDLSFVGFHELHDFLVYVSDRGTLLTLLEEYRDLPDLFGENHLKNGANEQQVDAYLLVKDWVDTYALFTGNLDDAMSPLDQSGVYNALKTAFIDNTYDINAPGAQPLKSYGISETAVSVWRTADEIMTGMIEIDHCHFEMRQDGVVAKSYYDELNANLGSVPLIGFYVHDCTFDHMFYQAVSSYCTNALFERITAQYCMQGVDISTCANHTVVRDCDFWHCAIGSKQACKVGFESFSHDNLIEGCRFSIDDQYCIMNTAHFMFLVEQGRVGDTFVMRDTSIDICSHFRSSGLVCRSYRSRFDGVTLNVNTLYHGPKTNAVTRMIELGGSLRSNAPYDAATVELVGCELNINCNVENISVPGTTAAKLNVSFDQCLVRGNGRVTGNFFNRCSHVKVRQSQFLLATAHLSDSCAELSLADSTFSRSSSVLFNFPDSNKVPMSTRLRAERCLLSAGGQLVDLKTSGGSFLFVDCRIKASSLLRRTQPQPDINGITHDRMELLSFKMGRCAVSIGGQKLFEGLGWSDTSGSGNGNDVNEWERLELVNNVFCSTWDSDITVSGSSSPVTPQQVAHVFYDNFLCSNITAVNEGVGNNKPLYPWSGMVYYNTSTNRYVFFGNGLWYEEVLRDSE